MPAGSCRKANRPLASDTAVTCEPICPDRVTCAFGTGSWLVDSLTVPSRAPVPTVGENLTGGAFCNCARAAPDQRHSKRERTLGGRRPAKVMAPPACQPGSVLSAVPQACPL